VLQLLVTANVPSSLNIFTLRFLQEPHGITSLKTAFFIVTAEKTANLTCVGTVCCLLMLVSCLTYSSILRMAATYSSEIGVPSEVHRVRPQKTLFFKS
jgi:hypothetical protein